MEHLESTHTTPGEERALRVAAMDPAVHAERVQWMHDYVVSVHERYRGLDGGEPASYIPELAMVEPDHFGISVLTTDGQGNGVGDVGVEFSIQSISKVLVYGLALEALGRERVLERVGVEPSGERFNAIVLDEESNRPFNPMVNAGAIAVSDLVPGATPADRLALVLEVFRRYLGHPVEIDWDVYRSEKSTGNRNRAIAYLMLSKGIIDDRVDETLDLYVAQCSVKVTAADLALIGATLANAGVNPLTGEVALERQYVRDVLSVSLTCGMYDYSGEWAYRVGLTAKSGVGGGIMAVLPGMGGLGVYSPRLDHLGNSARGIAVCEDMSEDLGVHIFAPEDSWLTAYRQIDTPVPSPRGR